MRIPFDITKRPQIESKEYKVETRDGSPARVVCWDANSYTPIVFLVTEHDDLDDKDKEYTYCCNNFGRAFSLESPRDLFIVTPEEELTEFEQEVSDIIDYCKVHGKNVASDYAKRHAKELLALAREQFIKDGYIIEKQAFHDAAENISDKHRAEMNIENYHIFMNISRTIEDGTRRAVMNWSEFQKLAQKFIDIGKAEAVKKYKYSWFNEGKIAGRFEGLAEDEKHQQGVHDGKEEALKDLPRWKKWGNGACGNGQGIPLAIVKRGLNGYELVDALGIQGEKYIMLSDLEKLPGFKEDESHE